MHERFLNLVMGSAGFGRIGIEWPLEPTVSQISSCGHVEQDIDQFVCLQFEQQMSLYMCPVT